MKIQSLLLSEPQNLRTSEPQSFLLCSAFVASLLAGSAIFCGSATAATLYGAIGDTISQVSSTGVVTPFVTGMGVPDGRSTALAFDANGNLFAAEVFTGNIKKISPAGVVSTFVTGLNNPTALAFDRSGNLFVSEISNQSIKKISPAGVVNTFVNVNTPNGLAFDSSGSLFVSSINGSVSKISATGVVSQYIPRTITTNADGFTYETGRGIAIDTSDYLYVLNQGTINKISYTGIITPLATGFGTLYDLTTHLAVDTQGNLFVSEFNGIKKVSSTGVVTNFAAGSFSSLAFAPDPVLPTAAPEPFTIIGTLIGGTAALRIRNKLKDANKS
jgi:hypothetical protein